MGYSIGMDITTDPRRFKAFALAFAAALLFPLSLGGCAPMFFHPARELVAPPGLAEGSPEEIFFHSGDGVRLHGWILRPTGPPKGTVLFLHGNSENMGTHVNAVLWIVKEGYLVFTFDYRGYGSSDGTPDIAGVNRDGVAALDLAFHIRGVNGGGVVVYGQSLGGAIAAYAVANSPRGNEVKALIVDSAFAGYRRIVRDRLTAAIVTLPLAWPASWTVVDRFSPERWIGSVAPVPVVVIHGTKDPVVPFSHGERLFRLAGQPKGFWKVEGGGHVSALRLPDVRNRFLEFIDSVVLPSADNPPSPVDDGGICGYSYNFD
ncbi:MAG: alpha/beta hydrolase [Candidatus Deferrimicrobiaceae bacterium]